MGALHLLSSETPVENIALTSKIKNKKEESWHGGPVESQMAVSS
jgi:hypothetical protein